MLDLEIPHCHHRTNQSQHDDHRLSYCPPCLVNDTKHRRPSRRTSSMNASQGSSQESYAYLSRPTQRVSVVEQRTRKLRGALSVRSKNKMMIRPVTGSVTASEPHDIADARSSTPPK